MQDARLAFRMVRLPGTVSMLSRSRVSISAGLWDLTDETSNAGGCAWAEADSMIAVKSEQAVLRPAGPAGKLVRSLDRPPHICIGGLFCRGGLFCIGDGLFWGCDCSRLV